MSCTRFIAASLGTALAAASVMTLAATGASFASAADEAAAMASEISASTEEMSASTQEMAATSQDLSRRASEQAQLVRAAADDAARILQIAATLAQGADEALHVVGPCRRRT